MGKIYSIRSRGRTTASRMLSAITAGVFIISGFAAASPLFLSPKAEAAEPTTKVVRPGDLQGWLFFNDENNTVDNTLGSFVNGPSTPPAGSGSAQISVSGTQRRNLATYQFANTDLSTITQLKYSTYNPSAGNGAAATSQRSGYLHFNVSFDGQDSWQRRLVFLPSDNGPVTQDTWKEWDTIRNGTALWRYSGTAWPAPNPFPGTTPKTWTQILEDYPQAKIRENDAFLGVRVGEPYADGYTENIDKIVFNETTYDFEKDKPATPGGLGWKNPTAACDGYTNKYTITADWNDVDGATKYEYSVVTPQRTNETAYTTPTTTSQYDGAFTEGTGTYTYRVRAQNADGLWSNWSSTCSIVYDTTAPTAPTLVSPNNNSTIRRHNFDFKWNPSSGATTYNFQAATDRNFTNIVSDRTGLTSTTLPSPNTPNDKYYWRVQAVDAAGNTSPWSNVWKVTVKVRQLRAPELKSPYKNTTVRDDDFTFRWHRVDNPNGGAVKYQFQSSSSNAVNSDGAFTNALANTVTSDRRLDSPNTPDGVYYWHIRALDAEGNPGRWSPVWKVTVRDR